MFFAADRVDVEGDLGVLAELKLEACIGLIGIEWVGDVEQVGEFDARFDGDGGG